jgi:hypothetical protein
MKNRYIGGIDPITPGSGKGSFIIRFTTPFFNNGDILSTPDNQQLRITKVYKYNWYRKLLNFFGIKFKLFNCVKVENYGK